MAPSLQHFTGAGGHQTGCQRITADELAHRAGHLVRGSKTMRLQDSPAGTRKLPLDGSIDWHGQRKVPVCNHAAMDSAYAADTTALPWLRSVPRSRLLCSCCSNKQQAVRCASLVGIQDPAGFDPVCRCHATIMRAPPLRAALVKRKPAVLPLPLPPGRSCAGWPANDA
jgi:hypothetical protein